MRGKPIISLKPLLILLLTVFFLGIVTGIGLEIRAFSPKID